MSYLKLSTPNIEYSTLGDDTEKEEKKIESEYFDNQTLLDSFVKIFSTTEKKLIIPHDFSISTYFPEVLTPPPSV